MIEDLSDVIARIEVDLAVLIHLQTQARLKAFLLRVEEIEKKKFGNWRNLPSKALDGLAKKVKQELGEYEA